MRAFRCPYFVTTVVVGVSAVAIALYWYWSPKKKACCKDLNKTDEKTMSNGSSSTSTMSAISSESEPRHDGGKDIDTEEEVEQETMFKFEDENVRKVCEKLFLEQMDLGEAYLENEETAERGAMHMANAIALTGETEQLLKVLKKAMSPTNFATVQKYIPSADMRVHQLLQDELAVETIHEHFGMEHL